jgi:hypothetical protein
MAEPDHTAEPGLTLEEAIGRPLKPLFEAYAAWRKDEAAAYAVASIGRPGPDGRMQYDYPEGKLSSLAFERELAQLAEHFIPLLAAGAWTARARPWNQPGALLSPVHPGDASRYSIGVDQFGASLVLYGPDGGKLYAQFAPAPQAPASAEPRKKAATERRSGRKPVVFERVCREMRATPLGVLKAMTHEGMKTEFNASAETCARAREQVQSEIINRVSDQNLT